ncbi:hypothetical protein AB0392_09600 [Nonomuraea angiospora]
MAALAPPPGPTPVDVPKQARRPEDERKDRDLVLRLARENQAVPPQ